MTPENSAHSEKKWPNEDGYLSCCRTKEECYCMDKPNTAQEKQTVIKHINTNSGKLKGVGRSSKLDLADAQFIGWGACKKDDGNILRLIEAMGLTKKEWVKWKKEYPVYPLTESEINEIDQYFEA